MQTDMVPIDKVHRLERNPRQHPERQMTELVKSVKQFGQYRPIIVDENDIILAGNGLYEAMTRAEMKEVAIHRLTTLTPEQKTKLILSDNKTGDMSSDDFSVVDEMLRELDDFEVPGYDPDVLRQLIATAEETTATAEQYGVLDPQQIENLNSRAASIDEANNNVTVGRLPEPMSIGDGSSWGAQGLGVASQQGAGAGAEGQPIPAENTHACPTCGRPW